MKKVAIVMGSDSDLPIVKKAAQVLRTSEFLQSFVFSPLTVAPQRFPSLQEMPRRTAQALSLPPQAKPLTLPELSQVRLPCRLSASR